MNRRQQLSILLALPALAATTLTSPAATAARSSRGGSHVGLLRNCSGQTVKVVVGSKVLTLLGPGAVKFKEIPSGRHTVLIVGRRSTKVLFRARIGVYGPGWRVRYMCSRKQKQRFRGSIRNCSRRTVKVYLDGRLKLTVPPRSVRRRKISGTHQVRLVPRGGGGGFSRKVDFTPGWKLRWGCDRRRRGRGGGRGRRKRWRAVRMHKCPRGHYKVSKRLCCPKGTRYVGRGRCSRKRGGKSSRRRMVTSRGCPTGSYRVKGSRICCPRRTVPRNGRCVFPRFNRDRW